MPKISLNLPDEDLATLRQLAEERSSTVTHVLRQSIATERFLSDEIKKGGEVLIKHEKSVQKVVFRP